MDDMGMFKNVGRSVGTLLASNNNFHDENGRINSGSACHLFRKLNVPST
jgi:hypothetical protein